MSLPDDVAAAAQELLEADLHYVLSPTALPAPAPMSVAEMDALLTEVEDGKQVILCAPDDFERVKATVYGAGLGLYYRVEKSDVLEPGPVYLMSSRREALTVSWPEIL